MATVFKPPALPTVAPGDRVVFLAGSIETGAAADWQARITERLLGLDRLVILNPRRDEWDASWRQSIDEPKFRDQVEWELAGLERAGCAAEFWRRGNIEVVCARYAIPLVAELEELTDRVAAACGAA